MSLAALGLAWNASAAEVKQRYRVLAQQRHPDREGGSHELFQELTAWVEAAELELANPAPPEAEDCPVCEGRGTVLITRGFDSLRLACAECGGSGHK